MSWQQVYNLLVQYGSREAIPAAELEAALAVRPAGGGGDPYVQIYIAELEYSRTKEKLKEKDDGQNRWQFG